MIFMKEQDPIIEVILSQESVDAIAKAVSEVMVDLLNDILIPLREDFKESRRFQSWVPPFKKYQRAVLR